MTERHPVLQTLDRALQVIVDPRWPLVSAALAQNAVCHSRLEQCKVAFYKLPVIPKNIQRGPRGGLYYINPRDHKIYVKHKQKRMAQERLDGDPALDLVAHLAAADLPRVS